MSISKEDVFRGLLTILFVAVANNAYSYQADVQYLPNNKYVETLQSEIAKARQSVFVVMYYAAIYPNQPNASNQILLNELVAAKKRGVKVEVLLDQNYDFDDDVLIGEGHNRNWQAFKYLKANGVDVFWDSPNTYTHNKVIVIDEETVILGSTNWTKASLTRNNESNAIIRSKEVALEMIADLRKIERAQPFFGDVQEMLIPVQFLEKKELLGDMVTSQDERAFQIYLYLLKKFDGNSEGKVVVPYDDLAKTLGIEETGREAYRRQIRKVLVKLKDQYQLLDLQMAYGKDDMAALKDLDNPKASYSVPKRKFVRFPETYWDYGWNKRLTFKSSVMYLISRHYAGLSGEWPKWSIGQKILAAKHNISPWFIGEGFQELREFELLDINYIERQTEEGNRITFAEYMHKLPYDYDEFQKELAELATAQDKDRIERIQGYAALGYAKYDLSAIKKLLEYEDRYGADIIKQAADVLAEKAPNNPKRHIGYLIGTIEQMGENSQGIEAL